MTDQVSKLRVSIDTKGQKGKVRSLRTELGGLTKAGEQLDAQNAIVTRGLRVMGGAFAAVAGVSGAGALVRDLQNLQSINSRIESLTGDLATSQQFLASTANELSAEYSTLADGYSRLLPLYQGGLLTLTQTQTITRGLANAQAATGASAADLGRVMFGLSQGFSAGTLRAEELNQVTEPMPGLLLKLDEAAGVAAGGFRKLVNDGQVTSSFFRDTLIRALAEYEGEAVKRTENITQTFNRTRNSYLKALEAFEQPISQASLGGAEALAGAFDLIGENAEEIIDVLQLVGTTAAVAFSSRAIGAGANSFASFVSDQRETLNTYIDRQKAAGVAFSSYADIQTAQTAKIVAAKKSEALAEATLAKEAASAELVRQSQVVADREAAVLSAQKVALKRNEALVETQNTLAIVQSTQAESARGVVIARQATLSATTTAARLQAAQALSVATASEAAASARIVELSAAESAAKTAATTANSKAEIQSRRLTQAKINEGRANSALVSATSAETAATVANGRAKVAVATANATLKTSLDAATAATARLTIAQRAGAVSSVAYGAAQRGLAGAVGLLGGPAGIALTAAAGLAFYALRQTEAEKKAAQLAETIDDVSDAFRRSREAGQQAADATRQDIEILIQKTEELLETRIKAAEGVQKNVANGFAIGRARKQVSETREELELYRQKLEEVRQVEINASFNGRFVDYYQSRNNAQREAIAAEEAYLQRVQSVGSEIDKLDTQASRVGALNKLRDQLESVAESMDPAEYRRRSGLITEAIAALNETTDDTSDAAEKMRAALESALPEVGRTREYNEQLALLREGFDQGGAMAETYRQAIAALHEEYTANSEDTKELERRTNELNNTLSQRIDDPFADYRTDLELFNRALADGVGDVSNIQRALANTSFQARVELTTVNDEDTVANVLAASQEQRAALMEFHTLTQTDAAQAKADLETLERNSAARILQINEEARDQVRSIVGEPIGIQFEIEATNEFAQLQALLDQGRISRDDHNEAVETLARQHQDELNQIVRDGEGTRSQIEQASYQSRYAGFLERNSAEIGLAQGFATELLNQKVISEQQQADASLDTLADDQARYDAALQAFEQNGSDQNRVALANADAALRISEQAARKQFKQQQDAAVNAAILQGGVAIANALATPPFFPVGISMAALAALQTANTIKGIKSGTFKAPSGSASASGGSSSTTATVAQPIAATGQGQAPVFFFAGNFESEEDAMIKTSQQVSTAVDRGYITADQAALGGFNTANVPQTTVRL